MLTVSVIILIAAFICCIVSAMGRCPLWVAVLLICVFGLLQVLPMR